MSSYNKPQLAKKSTAKRPRVEQEEEFLPFANGDFSSTHNCSACEEPSLCGCTRCVCVETIIESTNNKWESDDESDLSWELDSALVGSATRLSSRSLDGYESLQSSFEEQNSTLRSLDGYESFDSTLPQASSTAANTPDSSFVVVDEEPTTPTIAQRLEVRLARAQNDQEKVHQAVARLNLMAAKLLDQIEMPTFFLPNASNADVLLRLKETIHSSCDLLEIYNSKLMTSYNRMINNI